MGPRLRLALLITAGAHLGLVAAGALRVDLHSGGWAGRALAEYAALSGADGFYTFFAPGVDTQLRPIFEVTDGSGAVSTGVLKEPANPEVDIRVANLVSVAWSDDLRLPLFGAWADRIFARRPGAAQVVVRVELCEIPSMAEYRGGLRPAWLPFQRATFTAGEDGR